MRHAEPAPYRVGDNVLAALAARAAVMPPLAAIELVADRRRLTEEARFGEMLARHTVYITSAPT